MELIKDIIKIDNRIDFGKFQTFIESESVVPDKKLDVYDIIDTMGYIVLRKVEILEGKITFRGSFNYNVIYIADDKNTVSNINGKIELNEVIEKDCAFPDMEYMLYSEIEHIDCTIINERKIKVGALINVRGSLFEKQRLDIVRDVSQVEGIQKHRKEILFQDIVGIEKSESVVRDTITVNVEEIEDIININPIVRVKESRVTDNKVIIGGVLEISPLACTFDGEIVELDKVSIDFTQFIEVPGVFEGMNEEILMNIGDFNYEFKQNIDNNTGLLEIECTVFSKVKVCDEVMREVLQDAYSPQKFIKFEYRMINLNKTLLRTEDNFLVRDSLNYDNETIQIKDIVSVYCNASIENTYTEGCTCTIQGIIKVNILFTPVEGLKMLYKINEEIPFEHEIEIDDLNDMCSVFNTICIEKAEAELNKDQIELNIKIKRFIEVISKKSESFIVKGEDKGEYDLSKAPSIIIYICKENDTLWDIAKKYNTTEEEIAQTNEIDISEVLVPGKCLILEKKVVQNG